MTTSGSAGVAADHFVFLAVKTLPHNCPLSVGVLSLVSVSCIVLGLDVASIRNAVLVFSLYQLSVTVTSIGNAIRGMSLNQHDVTSI